MRKYLENLNNIIEPNHEFLEKLRKYAEEYKVPIIQRDSLVLIGNYIKTNKLYRILEIGTAIGYSSIYFASMDNNVYVDTIERNESMYLEAIKNIKEVSYSDKINVFFEDALEIDINKLSKYDMIFIDAAKAQYQKFFDKFSPLLNDTGIIFCDNIVFHDTIEDINSLSKNLRSMVKKIDDFNHNMLNNNNYDIDFIDSGDGLAIIRKRAS